MQRRHVAALAWGTALIGLAAADLALASGEADGDTLSEVTRTHVPAPVFVGCWSALTWWLIPHLYPKEH